MPKGSNTSASHLLVAKIAFIDIGLTDCLYIFGKSRLFQSKIWGRASTGDGETKEDDVAVVWSNGFSSTDLRATIVWTEPAAIPGCRFWVLNNRDLSVTCGAEDVIFPSGLSGPDNVNNAEKS
jgi:hypothetical protein